MPLSNPGSRVMWFRLGYQNFIGKENLGIDSCDIFISDFNRIWHKSLSNNEIFAISKKFNPLLEASVQKLKELTLNLLEDVGVEKEVREHDNNNNLSLKLHSNIMGVKFQFEVLLEQGDGEMIYKELTIPLLLLLIRMQNKEKKLIKIIKDKDAEIKNYKQEYGERPNYLATKPFSEKELLCNESETSISWDPSSLLDCISAKILSIEGMPKVITEEQPVDEEPMKKSSLDKCDKQRFIFQDKSFNSNNGSKPCVFLDNQTIKKRRKQNEVFKIKF